MRPASLVVGVIIVTSTPLARAPDAHAFGLECVADGARHHYDITLQANVPGISRHAQRMIAWNNDGLDVYMQNPLLAYWGPTKVAGVRLSFGGNVVLPGAIHEWNKLHFDNLFGKAQVLSQWRRYLYGAFYGLLWTAELAAGGNKKLAYRAAFNILGVTLHAIQDFYSHSSWVNDAQRAATPLHAYSKEQLAALPDSALYTGAYHEHDGSLSTPGKAPGGAVLHGVVEKTAGVTGLLAKYVGPVVSSLSPETLVALAKKYVPSLFNCNCTQDGKGVNLDRTCSATVGAKNRGLSVSGAALLAKAMKLAKSATEDFFARMGAWMNAVGQGDYWRQLLAAQPSDASGPGEPTLMTPAWSESFFDSRNEFRAEAPYAWVGTSSYAANQKGWYIRVKNGDWKPTVLLLARKDRTILGSASVLFSYIGHAGPFAEFPAMIATTADVSKLEIWAYRIGDDVAFGKIFSGPALGHEEGKVKWWTTTEPRSFKMQLDPWGASFKAVADTAKSMWSSMVALYEGLKSMVSTASQALSSLPPKPQKEVTKALAKAKGKKFHGPKAEKPEGSKPAGGSPPPKKKKSAAPKKAAQAAKTKKG